MSAEPEVGSDEITDDAALNGRREFLLKAGKFAAVTPPLMATMLAVTSTPALANGSGAGHSKGRGKGHGKGRGKGHSADG